jgi:hypothetical protein
MYLIRILELKIIIKGFKNKDNKNLYDFRWDVLLRRYL